MDTQLADRLLQSSVVIVRVLDRLRPVQLWLRLAVLGIEPSRDQVVEADEPRVRGLVQNPADHLMERELSLHQVDQVVRRVALLDQLLEELVADLQESLEVVAADFRDNLVDHFVVLHQLVVL